MWRTLSPTPNVRLITLLSRHRDTDIASSERTAVSTIEPNRSRDDVRRVALSSYLGTTIEYYDFLLYGTAAALVFNKVFFANLSPVVGTLVALSTLAAGYAARFVGAMVFGHFGDRAGRKNVMLVTMIAMGLTSGLIGLLPTYNQVGSVAPLLLV
ncbi:hypothetical protein RhoFasSB10_03912 [Rhodococcus fascians]|nr:hypothetical protein [Rhodococcus fascians]